MAKCGSTPMPVSPGSSNRIELRWVSRSLSSVVHCWPGHLEVLPVVLADGAGGGRLLALGVLRPAGRADEVRHSPITLPCSSPFLLDHRLQRLPVLQAGQHLLADHEHRHAADARLLVGVSQRPLMGFPVLPGPQRLLELLLIQPDLAGQLGQYADVADVLALDEERLQDPVVVVVALAVFLGVLVALEGQVRVRLRRHGGQLDGHAHPAGDGVDRLLPRPLEVVAFGPQRLVAGRAEARTASIRPRHPCPGRPLEAETPLGSRTVRRNPSRP